MKAEQVNSQLDLMLVGDIYWSENGKLLVNMTIRERARVHMHIWKGLFLGHLICLGLWCTLHCSRLFDYEEGQQKLVSLRCGILHVREMSLLHDSITVKWPLVMLNALPIVSSLAK